MQYMMKCWDNNMPLSYDILITQIMQVYGLDLSNDATIMLEENVIALNATFIIFYLYYA